jgi:hypothetical protein
MIDSGDVAALLAEYRAGLDAELALLDRLREFADLQREASHAGDLEALGLVSDARDGVMANLVTLEHQLKPIRLALANKAGELAGDPQFHEVAERHRDAAARVAAILMFDRESLESLKEAELARSFAARTLEQGETTLAAYRRVVAPHVSGAALVNRKG